MIRLYVVFLLMLLSGCTYTSTMTRVGVQDTAVESQIIRANDLAARYQKKDFSGIESILKADLEKFRSDPYARQHILNELADLYSYLILDIEQAVETDRAILELKQTGAESPYALQHEAANQQLLYAKSYRDAYLNISSAKIMEKAAKRLKANQSLLVAEPVRSSRTYSRDEMIQTVKDVQDDIGRTFPKSPDRYQMVSRLMRAEYELYRITRDPRSVAEGYKHLLNGEMRLGDAYFTEIDFISLADYLDIAYRNSGDIRLAEYALELIYKPYLRLADTNNRWLYNKMVNSRINTLIDGYYQRKTYDRMLYYISLNKSRMILEDKVRAELGKSSILAAGSSLFDPVTGLPRFDYFKSRLAKADSYLDFYMGGSYEAVAAGDNRRIQQAMSEASGGFAATRSIKRGSGGSGSTEVFISDSLYVTQITGGKIRVSRFDNRNYLNSLQTRLDNLYDAVSDLSAATRALKARSKKGEVSQVATPADFVRELKLSLPDSVTVSPDGWLSRYPFDWLLARKTIRTLNLFTYGDTSRINGLSIVGYFNPAINAPASPNNGDLPDADKELETLRPLLSNGTFYRGKDANIENLSKPIKRNILHLSMHGEDNPDDPVYSKLLFSGSTVTAEEVAGRAYLKEDLKALYARDMDRFEQLKGNELVFTAACQTGLTKKSATNQSEILGILRPLLINNNRNIILTLWPVESESAAMFVKSFYSRLARTSNIRDAFFSAQNELKKQYGHPAFWAPYYLVQSE